MADDYEIRIQEHQEYGVERLYVVWDLQTGKRVPFGNYRRHDRAEARIQRMRDRLKAGGQNA